MNNFNPDFLKGVAARVTAQFITAEKPLTASVAEVAIENSLNNEQIKRLIEVVNQVTYLKLLPTATDRTFEFPLARYEDVLSLMTSPDPESLIMTDETTPSPLEIASGASLDGLSKVASEEPEFKMGTREKLAFTNRLIYSTKNRLEKIAEEEYNLTESLKSTILSCREDDTFMEKAAMVTDGEEDLLRKVAGVVYGGGEVPQATNEGLFYDTELEQAKNTVALIKEATELLTEKRNLEEQLEKAAFVMPALNAAKGMAGAVAAKASSAGGKAMKAGEYGAAMLDANPDKNVWKSLQGSRTPKRNKF